MKKQKLLKNLRHRLSLLLCLMAFLAVGQGAWGTTYYAYLCKNQGDKDPRNMVYLGSTTDNSYTINKDFNTGPNYYMMFSTSATEHGDSQTAYNAHIYCNTATNDYSSTISAVCNDKFDLSARSFYVFGFAFSKACSSVKITISGMDSSTPVKATYTISAGGSPSPSETTPEVRVGAAPVVIQNTGATISAYLAKQGCHSGAVATVSKITAYYSIETPTKSTTTKQTITGTYTSGNLYDITIPASELNKFGTATIHVKLTATNNNTSGTQEGELSDEICFQWSQCAGIITSLVINPSSTQLTVNTPQTFTYTANDGAIVDNVEWYKNDVQVSTDNSYTFTPITGASFTIGLKAFNTSCNPDGFDAEPQTYTVCVPIGEVTITDCPSGDVEIGDELTIHASLAAGSGEATWVWTVNGAEQEVTVDDLTSSITYTPQSATSYTVVAKATDCTGAEKTAVCNFVVKKAFTANNLNKTFSACAGGHQFNWSDMFTPTPDSWSAVVTDTETDATALFTLKNGVMTWNNEGKAGGDYSYTFTAVKEGYKNATAVLSFTYTAATAPTGTIGAISIASGETPTYPWTAVNLQCTVSGADIANVVWSSSNSGLVVSTGIDGTTATAYFKGKVVRKDTEYTVTAEGQSVTCGSTAPQTITITVKPEKEEECY